MPDTHNIQIDHGGDVTAFEETASVANAEQDYYDMVADHGPDSAEALVALKYLHWLDRQR